MQTILPRWMNVVARGARLALCLLACAPGWAQYYPPVKETPKPALAPGLCGPCIEAHMEFLASDALRGRGSGTPDELVAATYIASQLHAYGLVPAGDTGGFVQKVKVVKQVFASAPELQVGEGEGSVTWVHGKDFQPRVLSEPSFHGPLQKFDVKSDLAGMGPGAIVFLSGDKDRRREAVVKALTKGAFAVLYEGLEGTVEALPEVMPRPEGASGGNHFNILRLSKAAAESLAQKPDGALVSMTGTLKPPVLTYTWNVLGMLPGSDPALNLDAILLSAHLDHLGVGEAVKGDSIYNGADDDASGTTAVLELARIFAAGPRPKRTLIFALFGSEEAGELGSDYFTSHPPLPLQNIAVNLNFEMIGRPDPKVKPDELWMTGWERSNLGPALAAHGGKLVADARPEQGFFERSDNYALAKRGVVAHTVSSFGLHEDYHHPSDDLAHIDFDHMKLVIGNMIAPLQWLANSDFAPQWNAGGQP